MWDIVSSIGWSEIVAFAQVVLIDLSLAGDNAIVIGMAAAGLPQHQRRKAIFYGTIGATVLRVIFACGAAVLMKDPGPILIGGGALLGWVSWKMFQEIRARDAENSPLNNSEETKAKTLFQAIQQIILADVSMSLDNVLAVAGAAREHIWVLVSGLALSVVLMGAAATAVERLLRRYSWLAYIGLFLIIYVAIRMIWDGAWAVWPTLAV